MPNSETQSEGGFENGYAKRTNQSEKIILECTGECGKRIIMSPRADTTTYPTLFCDCEECGPPFAAIEKQVDRETVWTRDDE